ncbi:MAG: hypothetical protein JXR22_06195 [Prolixibacteraceae bacterium]|nr:hypothetical protein [Prolixibacteraceae bacterium]
MRPIISKHKILILFPLFMCTLFAKAQFPNKDGRWFLRTFSPSGYSYCENPVIVEKDTIIGEHTYSIMKVDFARCAYRSDSLKVYAMMLFGDFREEFLIYDFGLQKGDTIQLLQAESPWGEKLDTVFYRVLITEKIGVYNQLKNRIELVGIGYNRTNLFEEWIEDIGSLSTPFYPIFFTKHEIVYQVYCYKEAMKNIYGACSLTSAEQTALQQNNSVFINCNNELIFSLDEQVSYKLSILAIDGKTCYMDHHFCEQQLNVSFLKPGTYICLLDNGNHQTTYKFSIY